jgi:hypothetical protein
MSKTYEELASEMTIAWMNAAGQAIVAGKFSADWLKYDSVKSAYKNFYDSILEAFDSIEPVK